MSQALLKRLPQPKRERRICANTEYEDTAILSHPNRHEIWDHSRGCEDALKLLSGSQVMVEHCRQTLEDIIAKYLQSIEGADYRLTEVRFMLRGIEADMSEAWFGIQGVRNELGSHIGLDDVRPCDF